MPGRIDLKARFPVQNPWSSLAQFEVRVMLLLHRIAFSVRSRMKPLNSGMNLTSVRRRLGACGRPPSVLAARTARRTALTRLCPPPAACCAARNSCGAGTTLVLRMKLQPGTLQFPVLRIWSKNHHEIRRYHDNTPVLSGHTHHTLK